MTADNVIHELDGHDNFLDNLDDPQESVILENDNEFSDLKEKSLVQNGRNTL